MVTGRRYIAIYIIARVSTRSYVENWYGQNFSYMSYMARRINGGTGIKVIKIVESNQKNRWKMKREANRQKYHVNFEHLQFA